MMAAFPLKGDVYGERLSLPSSMYAGTAEPVRVSPPEAVAYLLELRGMGETDHLMLDLRRECKMCTFGTGSSVVSSKG